MALLIGTGVQSDDVFAFAGAIVGAAGTVAGTAWLSDRSRNATRREEQSVVREELVTLLEVSSAAERSAPDPNSDLPWHDNWKSNMHALADVGSGCNRFLAEVLDHAATLNFHQREAVKELRETIAAFLSFHSDVFDSNDELPPWDDREWKSETAAVTVKTAAALLMFKDRYWSPARAI